MENINDRLIQDFVHNGLKGKSESTIDTYVDEIKLFAEYLDVTDATLEDYARIDVQQYIDYLVAKKKAATTINKKWNAIKKFSKWIKKYEAIEDIRVIKAKDLTQEAPKSLSRIEVNKLLRDVDRTGNKRDIAIIVTLLNAGLRVSELTSLNKSSIDFSDRKGEILVIGKGNKERVIPANPETRRAISKYLETRNDNNPALFMSNFDKRISQRTVQRLLAKYGTHPHALRHTFITQLVRSGEDWSLIASLTGHDTAEMIKRYSQPTIEDKQRAVDELLLNG